MEASSRNCSCQGGRQQGLGLAEMQAAGTEAAREAGRGAERQGLAEWRQHARRPVQAEADNNEQEAERQAGSRCGRWQTDSDRRRCTTHLA